MLQVQNLNKKNYRSSVTECRELVNCYGAELQRHLFRSLLSQLPSKAQHAKAKDLSPCLNFLQEETEKLSSSDRFTSLLIWCVDKPLSGAGLLSPRLLVQYLKFTPLQELHFSHLLSQFSSLGEVRSQAKDLVAERLPSLISLVLSSDVTQPTELPFLKTLVEILLSGDQAVEPDLVTRLLSHLRSKFDRSSCPVSLLPLLHPTPSLTSPALSMSVKGGGLLDGALPDLVLEMGYHFTASVEECRAALLQVLSAPPMSPLLILFSFSARRQGSLRCYGGQSDRSDGPDPHWAGRQLHPTHSPGH